MQPFKINLDYKQDCYEEIKVSMLDTVKIEATITDNWQTVDLAGANIQMQIGKNDGRFVIQTSNITVVGNKVSITLDEQATVLDGITELTLVINQNGERKGLWIINLSVRRTSITNKVDSITSIPLLEDLENAIIVAGASKVALDISVANGDTATMRVDIDNHSSQLAEIPNQTYITEKARIVDLNSTNSRLITVENNKRNITTPIALVDLSQDVLTAMTGGSVAVVGENVVDTINTKNNAITYEKTTYKIAGLLKLNDNLIYNKESFTLTVPSGYCSRDDFGGRSIIASNFPTEHPSGKFTFTLTNANDFGTLYFDIENAKNNLYPFIWQTLGYETEQVGGRYQEIAKIYASGVISRYSVQYEIVKNSITLDKLDLSIPQFLTLNDAITFNPTTLEIIIPSSYVYVGAWRSYTSINYTVPNGNPTRLYFDTELAKNNLYPFIWKENDEKITQSGTRYQEIIMIAQKSIISKYTCKYIDVANLPFNPSIQRFVLPKKMFFIEEEPLKLYKSSMLADRNLQEKYKSLVNSNYGDNYPYIKYFDEDIELRSSDLFSTFDIDIVSNDNPSFYYTGTVEKVSKVASTVVNKTPKIIVFGDSVQAVGTPTRIKQNLSTYGINATMLGTYTDSILTTPCEARSGWMYSQYIGKRTTLIDDTPIVSFPNFLKLANATDKNNHPDWCFRRTGVKSELSYTTDSVKTGDFYIFDFANYLSINAYPSIDVITIAMGTNDLGVATLDNSMDSAIATCKLAVTIMASQILSTNPNCKIGIIPTHTFGTGQYANTFQDHMVRWVEECVALVDTLNTTLNNKLDVIGVYCHQCGDIGGLTVTNTGTVSPSSRISAMRIDDNTHPNKYGTMEDSKPMSFYIINQL